MDNNLFRRIPKMDRLLSAPEITEAGENLSREYVKETIRETLDAVRRSLQNGGVVPDFDALVHDIAEKLRKSDPYSLRTVINGTGVVLHTNLGRAPLGREVAARVAEVAAGYCNVEYDLEAGTRGSRYDHIEKLLCRLAGAEAAMVVNNNAAAVFLMLNTLAENRRVAVSRSELVEIGGAFRVPDIMKRSGAELVEVGTTNKTHICDYEEAIRAGAEVLLKVHRSNFKIMGFFEEPALEELKNLSEESNTLLLYDVGAGFMLHPENQLLQEEGIFIPDAVKYADVVCFSGDKLLGSSQAGIICGKKSLIDRMKKNQLTRMLRVDKLTLAALEAVLRIYADPADAAQKIPALQMLEAKEETLRTRAEAFAHQLTQQLPEIEAEAVPCTDEPGGGSLPAVELNGWAVAIFMHGFSPEKLEALGRTGNPSVIGRIHKGRYIISVRTLMPGDEEKIIMRLKQELYSLNSAYCVTIPKE